MRSFVYVISIVSAIVLFSCRGEQVDPNPSVTKNSKVKKSVKGPKKPKPKSTAHLNTGGMEWMTMDKINEIESPGSKMYLIDVYTEWCGWCKIMDKKTFSDPKVQDKLKEAFHLVKFDAENKDPIQFNGKTYKWKEGGRRGNNELAIELLKGRMSYPSLVFLDKDLNPIKISPGYKNPDQMIQELEIIAKS